MLDSKLEVAKVTGLGVAKVVDEEETRNTADFFSPRDVSHFCPVFLLHTREYKRCSDVYSFGILLL